MVRSMDQRAERAHRERSEPASCILDLASWIGAQRPFFHKIKKLVDKLKI